MDVSIVPGQTESQEVRQSPTFFSSLKDRFNASSNSPFSDELLCKNEKQLIIDETWTVIDISLVSLVIATILLILIVCGMKYYRYQRPQEVSVLPRRRELPKISHELLSSCPTPPPQLPPPYSIENTSHYIEQDANKPPTCDLILQQNEE